MKKTRKPLGLNRETLLLLTPNQLRSAAGGKIKIETQTCSARECSEVTCDTWDGKASLITCDCP